MNRQEIIQLLDKPVEYYSKYYALKQCLEYNNHTQADGTNTDTRIDEWFAGVIGSLYYMPNYRCLVLLTQDIQDQRFFTDLFPKVNRYSYQYSVEHFYKECIYDFLFINNQFQKNTLDIVERDEWRTISYTPTVIHTDFYNDVKVHGNWVQGDKRLTSYCSVTKLWPYPARKNFIVLKVDCINWELYDSINKLDLWIEIFNKFKPQGK